MIADPLFLFVFVGLITPGPNVVLLIASGARFGFSRTVPHILGVAGGVGLLAAIAGFGVGALLLRYPTLTLALKLLACGWILYLALRLFRSLGAPEARNKDRPFTFVEAVLFQWVNPKVWAVAMAASAGFGSGLPPAQEAVRIGLTFSSVNLGVCLFYAYAGGQLGRWLHTPALWRRLMVVLSALMALSGLSVFL